jgi:hypothetical protein
MEIYPEKHDIKDVYKLLTAEIVLKVCDIYYKIN